MLLRIVIRATENPATFDLQSVLQILHPYTTEENYLLSIYVFMKGLFQIMHTVLPGLKFMVPEGALKLRRLYRYLENLPEGVTEISFFSDTCGGQNRNEFVIAMIYYFLHSLSDHNITVFGV